MKKKREERIYRLEVATQEHYDAAKAMVDPYWNHLAEIKIIEDEMQTVPFHGIRYNQLEIIRNKEIEAAEELYNAMFEHKRQGDKLLKKTEPRWWRR